MLAPIIIGQFYIFISLVSTAHLMLRNKGKALKNKNSPLEILQREQDGDLVGNNRILCGTSQVLRDPSPWRRAQGRLPGQH